MSRFINEDIQEELEQVNSHLKQLNPITLELRLSYTIDPLDHLPDDWQGTREDAIEWFRSDIAENLHEWITPQDVYEAIREANK